MELQGGCIGEVVGRLEGQGSCGGKGSGYIDHTTTKSVPECGAAEGKEADIYIRFCIQICVYRLIGH